MHGAVIYQVSNARVSSEATKSTKNSTYMAEVVVQRV